MTQLLLSVLVVGGYLAAMTITLWLIGVLTGGDATPADHPTGSRSELGVIRVVSRQRGPAGRR